MTPLRKMDKLIAETIFGHSVSETDDSNGIDNYWIDEDTGLPFFSSLEEDSMRLFTSIAEMAHKLDTDLDLSLQYSKGEWTCTIGSFANSSKKLPQAITSSVISYFNIKEDDDENNTSSRSGFPFLRRLN